MPQFHWEPTLASTADFSQVEEYETDSDDSDNDVDIESEELIIGISQ